jgi:DNA-binding NarL/FixJ family response regulator
VHVVRTFVVHHHHVVAETLSRRLSADPVIRAVGVGTTSAEARAAMGALRPDVAIVDLGIDQGSALALITELTAGDPSIAVVALLNGANGSTATRAVRAGANAVARSGEEHVNDLVAAVLAVGSGDGWLPPDLLGYILDEFRASLPPPNRYVERLARLTPREREVLDHMVAGHDRATIAKALTVSLNTVRTHTQNILTKLEVHSGLEAVSLARRAMDVRR